MTDTSGPAFPSGEGPYAGGPHHAPGMSLRDWFAGRTVSSLLQSSVYISAVGRVSSADVDIYASAARDAYIIADEMLKAREKA